MLSLWLRLAVRREMQTDYMSDLVDNISVSYSPSATHHSNSLYQGLTLLKKITLNSLCAQFLIKSYSVLITYLGVSRSCAFFIRFSYRFLGFVMRLGFAQLSFVTFLINYLCSYIQIRLSMSG